jgi:hypothetical protein
MLSSCSSDSAPPARAEVAALSVRDRKVTRLSGEHEVSGVAIGAGAVLEFDPHVSTTLVTTGNVVVRGILRMRPARPDVVHTIRFTDVDESRFIGEVMEPVDSDVGLWVIDRGALDLRGTPRTGWNRTGWERSWRDGDEVLAAPQAIGDFSTYRPLGRDDAVPYVTGPNARQYSTEIFNLTRNVVIEGARDARAHVFIRSTAAQSIRYVLLRWLGPRKPFLGTPRFHHADRPSDRFGSEGESGYPEGGFSARRLPATEPVIGRYPLHFHHCDDGSRGSLVEGCVIRDSSRAYVPHASHGITMRDCIAFRIVDDAYWWDEGHPTDDLVWDHCAAFDVRFDPPDHGDVAAFMLGQGQRPVVRDCVAVGVHGGGNDTGFLWPAFANLDEDNVWESTDLVAHNCHGTGVYVWQDDDNAHVVERLLSYRNGNEGLVHGARRNSYRYEDIVLFDNGAADLLHQALSQDDPRLPQYQSWTALWAPRVVLGDHSQASTRTITFEDATIATIVVDELSDGAGSYVFHADLDPHDIRVSSRRSDIRVVRPDGSTFSVAAS